MGASMSVDWSNLGFNYIPTNGHMRAVYKNGKWGPLEFHIDPNITMPIASTALHYGQAAFEGLKAFTGEDGVVRIFRPEANSERINRTADRLLMPQVPEELFMEAVTQCVDKNRDFIPPFSSKGAFYLRPFLIGTGPQIGVRPSEEYTFIVLGIPVGPYYKGAVAGVSAIILTGYDRAAPNGLGSVKAAGNYAANLLPDSIAKSKGHAINLYLDSRLNLFIDEFGTSNFICVTNEDEYVTPESPSILPSITNNSLFRLAESLGFNPKRRPIEISELANLKECGACGTAVVITPIKEVHHEDRVYQTGPDSGFGPKLQALYTELSNYQYSLREDTYGWLHAVENH